MSKWTALSTVNMRRLLAILVLAFFHAAANASGYGWYVLSFNWGQFLLKRGTLDARVVQERKKNPSTSLADTRNIVAYGFFQDEEESKGTSISLKDESPQELEFYWPEALEYAAKIQTRSKTPTFFTLFETGRSLWDSSPSESFLVLSPDEVRKFYYEVSAMNRKTRHPKDYTDYLVHLESVLKKTSGEGRALVFLGHD